MESIAEDFSGRVALIYPQVDSATRTNRVRFEVENPRGQLRPGMFATVRIAVALGQLEPFGTAAKPAARDPAAGEVLAVPERAVIDTGSKQIVYVQREPGLFEGVEVQLGARSGEFYEVRKGLRPGDRVVAAGAFLVDAETRLNPAAAATFFGASGGPATRTVPQAPPPRGYVKRATPEKKTGRSWARRPKRGRLRPAERCSSPRELANIAKLPALDRPLALAQRFAR